MGEKSLREKCMGASIWVTSLWLKSIWLNNLWTDDIHVESDMWVAWYEDSLVVPFWLKAVTFFSHHGGDVPRSGDLDG